MKALLLALLLPATTRAVRLAAPVRDTAVVVRTHSPSDGMKRRMLSLADDILTNLPNAITIISADDTGLSDGTRWEVPLPEMNVHHLVWDDVKMQFPLVPWDSMGTENYPASGLNYHMEPIILTLEHARKYVSFTEDAQVWVLEDDVLVCGNFSDIVKYYKSDDSDLLTKTRAEAQTWPNRDMSSDAFAARYPLPSRKYAMQFVERFSTRFLDYIHTLSRNYTVTAQSEMFAPTVCEADHFKCGLYNASHVGNSSSWFFNSRLTPSSASLVCQDQPLSMHHAAKFFQTSY